MTGLNDIYVEAEQNGFDVICFRMPKAKAMSIMDESGNYFIGIDPFELSGIADEKVKLAHEMGHCSTGSFYNRHSSFNNIAKQEATADRWAVKRLIPFEELDSAFDQGLTQVWQLAEYFEVTESFILTALEIYTIEGLYTPPVCE